MKEPEYLLFPLVSKDGFKVDGDDSYLHLMKTILDMQVDLQEIYPEDFVVVFYEL